MTPDMMYAANHGMMGGWGMQGAGLDPSAMMGMVGAYQQQPGGMMDMMNQQYMGGAVGGMYGSQQQQPSGMMPPS